MQTEWSRPCVSVIMPAYNAEKEIEQAVRSVMAQTVSDWELLVIDDRSQDGTLQILQKLAQEDHRIRVFQNAHNLGAALTRNRGLDLCRGEYAALLDSDDIWYPDKLDVQLEIARKEKAEIVYCSYTMADTRGEPKYKDFIVPERTNLRMALVQSVISCSTALLSRSVVERYRFSSEYYHEDLVMWLQLLGDGCKAVGTRRVLAQYRIRRCSRASNKLAVACHRWKIYRHMMGMNIVRSTACFLRYAAAGFWKYQRGWRKDDRPEQAAEGFAAGYAFLVPQFLRSE